MSEHELHHIDEAHALASELVGRKVTEIVIITQGANGAIVTSRTDVFQITPPMVEVKVRSGW